MAEVVIMPKLGFDMDAGTLVKWHKSVGETISVGELFYDIETDKTAIGVDSPISGMVLKILLSEGESAAVFTPIAVVGQQGEDVEAALAAYKKTSGDKDHFDGGGADGGVGAAPAAAEDSAQASTAQAASVQLDEIKVTPRAKKYIADNNVDPGVIAQIKGTGFEGGITEADVKASPLAKKIASRDGVDLSKLEGSGPQSKVMKADVQAQGAAAARLPASVRAGMVSADSGLRVASTAPYKGVRKIIGDKLSQSMVQSPHIYFTDEVDVGPMTDFRAQVTETLGEKISVTDILVMAASRALTKYPGVNSSLIGDKITTYESTNIGVAVAGDKGLIVPVIKNVQDMSISELARASRDLIERARTGSIGPDEYTGGTFTISNLGMFGIENFTAIINPPEAAIIAISAAKKKPVVVTVDGEDKVVIKSMMKIQLSVDHRLIDGLLAAQFTAYFKELLETPLKILL